MEFHLERVTVGLVRKNSDQAQAGAEDVAVAEVQVVDGGQAAVMLAHAGDDKQVVAHG
jgi:hypothetical protein